MADVLRLSQQSGTVLVLRTLLQAAAHGGPPRTLPGRPPAPPAPPPADSPLRTGTAPELAAVDPEEWNSLLPPGRGPLAHGYLSAWLHADLPGLEARPLLARTEDGELVAAAPAYLYDLDLARVRTPLLARVVAALRVAAPRLMAARVLELGGPAAASPPILVREGFDERAAADAIVRRALREAREQRVQMVIVQDFWDTRTPIGEALRAGGFSPVPLPHTAAIDVPFDSFDAYLGAMRSHYRRRARRVLHASKHLRVERIVGFSPLAEELARLWRLVFDRADEVKRECLPVEFFRDVALLDEVSALVLWRPDGSIAAYALLLDDRPSLHFLYTGFEASAGEQESAYFRLLYEIVRAAIDRGFERVELGITTLPPKLDVGARPVPLYGWLRHRNGLLQTIFASVAAGAFAPPPVEPRNVFKSA